MKDFKQFIKENIIDDGLGFGEDGGATEYNPSNPAIFFGTSLGTSSKAIAGIDPSNMPYVNYRSAALSPGEQQEDPNYVAGGGGFKIEKDSKSFLLNIAKKYGILIPDKEKQQQGGMPGNMGGGQNPMAAMMGGQQSTPQQSMPQMSGPGGEQQETQDRLVQHLSMNPIMAGLMGGDLGQEFNKIFKEMQKWKTDAQNPQLIQKSQEPQNPYKIWAEKAKEEEERKKQNISVQGNILRHRMFASDIYNRLDSMGLHDYESNIHVKNYMDPNNHDEDLLQQMQQEQQPQYQDEEDYYNDSETGVDFGYYGQ